MSNVAALRIVNTVSIHAFRGEGDFKMRAFGAFSAFQSTPSGGKATLSRRSGARTARFQSTPSGGKATRLLHEATKGLSVSIHAFRGEGD